MFDVEKMKKLNDLAKELQKHNFADDSQEAYKFAEKIYAEKASDIFGSSIPEASQTEPEVQAESVRVETQKQVERQETINVVEKKEVPKESHPRQGDFKSSDVPIEKFFYFGK